MKVTSLLFLLLLIAGCSLNQQKANNIVGNQNAAIKKDTASHKVTNVNNTIPAKDSLKPFLGEVNVFHKLIEKGASIDTGEVWGNNSFLYCKIGNFIDDKEKTAVLIYNPNATYYTVEFFTYLKGVPLKTSVISDLQGVLLPEFDIKYKDYNFDGRKDIFLQYAVSNGTPMFYGYLLTINKESWKLERHPECDNLADLKPDFKNKFIVSDSIIWCDVPFREKQVCKVISKWENGKLVMIKNTCHCKG